MKKFTIATCISAVCIGSLFGNSADIAEFDRFFNEIGEIRTGIANQEVDNITNPFVTIVVPSSARTSNTPAPTFKLSAIIENKAKINDSWLTQGSTISGLRVIAIKQNSVVLGNENRAIELFLREKNENSIITIN